MIKFGAVGIDVSHPKMFASAFEKIGRGQYTAVFNDGFRGRDEVEAFAKMYNLKICETLDELVDEVDLGFVHGCNWDKHVEYAKAFVKKGKPVFIDKPIVGNLKECRELLELVKGGAKIVGTSALRYCDEVMDVKKQLAEQEARPVFVDVTVGVDEYNYAIHAVEQICGLVDDVAVSCKYINRTEVDGQVCDTYLVKFKNGASAMWHGMLTKFELFNTIVISSSPKSLTDFCFAVDNDKIYPTMLNFVCDYVEGKEDALCSMEDMVHAVKIMLAAKASKDNGGIEVSLDSGLLETTSYDGYAFEKGYAAKAKKIFG